MHSLKHINAYLFLHGKPVSKKAVDAFLKMLQKDIRSGKITHKKDDYCKEVDRIQRSLVGMSDAMRPDEVCKVVIEAPRKKHYESIMAKQGMGSLPVMVAGALTALTTHHIHKIIGAKPHELKGIKKPKKTVKNKRINKKCLPLPKSCTPDCFNGKKIKYKKSLSGVTPLRDAYLERISHLNKGKKITDISKLEVGDMVNIPSNQRSSGTQGFVKSIGRKNIIIESPYGGYGDADYIQIMEIKRGKEEVKEFLKPKKSVSGPQKSAKKKDGLTGKKYKPEFKRTLSKDKKTITLKRIKKTKKRKSESLGSTVDHEKRVELVSAAVKEAISPLPAKTGMKASEMQNHTYDELQFNDLWKNIFGNPATNFDMCIHAGPGTGKTVFLLKFANYLADHIGPVVYITPEEFKSATLTKKIKDFGITSANLTFEPKILPVEELKKYKFIFIDSVNRAKISCAEYQNIREQVPDSAFILVLQQTKGGTHKGGNDWPHEVEVAAELTKDVMGDRYVNFEKDRYGDSRIVKI